MPSLIIGKRLEQKPIKYILSPYREMHSEIEALKSKIHKKEEQIYSKEIALRKHKQFFSLLTEIQETV